MSRQQYQSAQDRPPITSPRSGRVRRNKLFAMPQAQDEEL
jgi:hypothetical protein